MMASPAALSLRPTPFITQAASEGALKLREGGAVPCAGRSVLRGGSPGTELHSACIGRRGQRPQRSFTVRADVAVKQAVVNATAEVEVPAGSVSVVLLAGGVGKRMGADMPKQYLPLLDQPIALYSLYLFSELPEVGEIVVVCDPSYRHIFLEAASNITVPIRFALPGKERQDSVYSGLQEISKAAALVAVHDSARPLVTAEDTRKVIHDGMRHGAAVLGVPVKATIKEAGSNRFVTKTLDRRLLWEMQTPQVIRPSLLHEGFDLVNREKLEVTDDVSIVEHLHLPVCITEGSYTNLKVTTPDDLLVAERILSQKKR